VPGAGLPLFELSLLVLFIELYGRSVFLTLPAGLFDSNRLSALSKSLFAASGLGLPALAYAWNGFLNVLFCFCGVCCVLAEFWRDGNGELPPGIGDQPSGRSFTKLLGNNPTILLSLLSLPIHHDPSPAFRHSMRSPSMKPRSRFVCPLSVYITYYL
jgi:hypothetical protein